MVHPASASRKQLPAAAVTISAGKAANTTLQTPRSAASVIYADQTEAQQPQILANGETAPNFTVMDVKGSVAHLSDFADKVVVIDFWSTWCGPCQMSLPGTDKLAKKYAGKNVVFLPICSWDNQAAFTKWVTKHKTWTMTFYFDPAGKGNNSIAGTQYSVSGIPTQFVIGKDGKVAYGSVGYGGEESEHALAGEIDKALAAS